MQTFAEIEKRIILTRLADCGYIVTSTAASLDIGVRTIQRKLKSYGYTAEQNPLKARDSLREFVSQNLEGI
jgi:DNA-binding NtrC family response regulator